MTKHTFIHESQHIDQPDLKVIVETDAITVDELLEAFEQYLRGCGFTVEGSLDIIGFDKEKEE